MTTTATQTTPNRDARSRRPARGKYIPKRKVCFFCRDKVQIIDYKDPAKLRPYISDRGKISPRRKSGACAKHQRALATAIKRARHLALLPFVAAHMRKTGTV
jgi:small subunit ribosomal protein S18